MKKAAGIIGIVLAAVLLVLGFVSTTPDKYIRSYGDNRMHEYVGGDAYNYIIEASLRGGEISGAKTAKAIYFAAAGIIFVLSLSFMKDDEGKDEIRKDIGSVKKQIEDAQTAASKLTESITSLQKEQLAFLMKPSEQQGEPFPQESHPDKEDDQ